MGHLYKFNLLRILRKRADMFWTLFFPLILGSFFYISFGTKAESIEQINRIPVALVQEGNEIFETFLGELNQDILEVQTVGEEEALELLKSGDVDGIFYSKTVPTLSVAGVQINESILGSFLNSYLQNQRMMEEIGKKNPLKLLASMKEMMDFQELIQPVSAGGREIETSLSYYFALIGMTCLFGAFSGMTSSSELRANQSPLAARRSVAAARRFRLVVSELLAVFTVQFANCCILLLYLHFGLKISFGARWYLLIPVCMLGSICGAAIGILIGCLRLGDGPKMGMLVGGSLAMSFLAGLMFGNMKDIIEHHFPLLNRINPAALISDAFYSISIYENFGRYQKDLLLLGTITVILAGIGYVKLRRERYDSL